MWNPMFVPPRHHAGLYWFARTFVPRLGRLFGNVHDLSVDEESEARLRALEPHRAILCPNHPTETDPIVVFWLGRNLGQYYHFLATRETLDGPRGKLLNHIGVYSVIRGYPDRESLKYSRKLLAELDRKVVIFPEGLVYEHNDRLLEFQSGVAQLGFWALDDLEKAGKEPRLPLLPLAIKYRCLRPPKPYMEAGLQALEEQLELPAGGASHYERLTRIGETVVGKVEKAEGLKADSSLDLTARILRARRAVLDRVAEQIGVEVDEKLSPGDQLHAMTNELKRWVGVPEEAKTEYDERLHQQRAKLAQPLHAELMRLHNTVAVTGNYIAQEPTAERFLEVLGRLQKEVLGKVPHQAPLGATVRVGEALPLEERREAYRARKRETVSEVTGELQARIRTMLEGMRGVGTPL